VTLISDRDKVVSAIVEAFSLSLYPAGASRNIELGGSLEAQQVEAYFYGVEWKNVNIDFIRKYDCIGDASACLAFMAPAAFRYYIPAFMILVLKYYNEVGLLADTTVSNLTGQDGMAERFIGFDDSQRQAIRMFLIYLAACHAEDYSVGVLENALRSWQG
jgi:hypothetical protein